MAKKCSICGELNDYTLYKWCKKCYYSEVRIDEERNPIKQISDTKKKRLKEEGSKSELFRDIWNERQHECEQCGKYLGEEMNAHFFDHIKGKGMNKNKRLDKDNIKILCFAHHFEKNTGLVYKGINLD